MPARELVMDALSKADECSPPVRACARLHAARVMAQWDKVEARKLLQQALQELDELSSTSHEHFGIDREAYLLAGAVAPDLARQYVLRTEYHRQDDEPRFINVLLGHGHIEAAVDLLLSYDHVNSYPFGAVGGVMNAVADAAINLALLRKASEVWLRQPSLLMSGSPLARKSNRVRNHSRAHQFAMLFASHWDMLPVQEALRVLRSVVVEIVQSEDSPFQAQFGPEDRVTFKSRRQYCLFEILHVLRRLDPELAGSLMSQYPELAAAAALFPFGQESVIEAWQAQRPIGEAGGTNRACIVLAGSERAIALSTALVDGQQLKQFERAFKQAQAFLDDDLQDNLAIKECWPSTQAFRRLLFSVGETFGEAGVDYLKQIPDLEVRLFAQIEFAAALAGVPQMSGTESTASRRDRDEIELTND